MKRCFAAILRVLPATAALWQFQILRASAAVAEIENPINAKEFKDVVSRFADYALTILGPLSIIVVLAAGAMYMTAGGNPERLKRANKTLLWAVIGIAIVLLAKSAELIMRDLLGVE